MKLSPERVAAKASSRGRSKRAIASRMEKQGITFAKLAGQQVSDEDDMVAGVKSGVGFTLVKREEVFQYRHSANAVVMGDTRKLVFAINGEVVGDILLPGMQHMNSKMCRIMESGERQNCSIDAPQNKWGIDGDGSEAVDGHCDGSSLRVGAGDNGDAGGELSHGLAELRFTDFGHGLLCVGIWSRMITVQGLATKSSLRMRCHRARPFGDLAFCRPSRS